MQVRENGEGGGRQRRSGVRIEIKGSGVSLNLSLSPSVWYRPLPSHSLLTPVVSLLTTPSLSHLLSQLAPLFSSHTLMLTMKLTSATLLFALSGVVLAVPVPSDLLPNVSQDCLKAPDGPNCLSTGKFLHHLTDSEAAYLHHIHPEASMNSQLAAREVTQPLRTYGYPVTSSHLAVQEGAEEPDEKAASSSSGKVNGMYLQANHPSGSTPFSLEGTGGAGGSGSLQQQSPPLPLSSSLGTPSRIYNHSSHSGTSVYPTSGASLQTGDQPTMTGEVDSLAEAADKLSSKGTLSPATPSPVGHTVILAEDDEKKGEDGKTSGNGIGEGSEKGSETASTKSMLGSEKAANKTDSPLHAPLNMTAGSPLAAGNKTVGSPLAAGNKTAAVLPIAGANSTTSAHPVVVTPGPGAGTHGDTQSVSEELGCERGPLTGTSP